MKILSLLKPADLFPSFMPWTLKTMSYYFGHDGPAHFAMSDGKVKLVPLPVYHGKPGKGIIHSNDRQEWASHPIVCLCEGKEGIFLLVAEGESVPGPVLEIGNTNSRYRFSCGVKALWKTGAKLVRHIIALSE